MCLGKRGVCYPLKHVYDKANLILEGQISAMDENCNVVTDAFGVPTVIHKIQKEDTSVPEKSDQVIEIERMVASNRFKRLPADEPDAIPEPDQESDGEEAFGGDDEDPDVPQEKILTDFRRVSRTIKVDRHGTTMTAKTPQTIPLYTNEEWRRIEEPTQIVMLADYDRRQKRKRIRGVRGDWAGLSDEQRQEVRQHFDRLQEERRSQMEAAMPAPDDDWGIGICDLNVEQLEKQLRKLEREKDYQKANLARSLPKTQKLGK